MILLLVSINLSIVAKSVSQRVVARSSRLAAPPASRADYTQTPEFITLKGFCLQTPQFFVLPVK